MQYNFDTEVSRKNTHSVKWELLQSEENPERAAYTDRFFGENPILPMWVADMDFASPQPVIDALTERAQHGIFGYTYQTASYLEAVINWMEKRHGWSVQADWICTTPGVVSAVNMLVQAFVAPGQKVLLQKPVYYPFFSAINNNQAQIVSNSLRLDEGRYRMDFADLAEKAADPTVTMAILCNPHNPVGRVWSRDELQQFGEICLQNNVLVIADEIHGDLIYSDHTFTPFASLSPAFAENSITCTAPSKTFNLAGLHTSNIIIQNKKLRVLFQETLRRNGLSGVNPFGVVALEAAYNHGDEWLAQVMAYIEGNLRYLEEYITANIPQIKVIHPEGTYLVWLDCRALGLDKMSLRRLMLTEAGVYLDEGFIFGAEGEGFERVNIACTRAVLTEALTRIKHAVDGL